MSYLHLNQKNILAGVHQRLIAKNADIHIYFISTCDLLTHMSALS